MSGRPPRHIGVAPEIRLLGAGVVFVFGLVGWASEARRDQPSQFFPATGSFVTGSATALGDVEAQATLDAERSGQPNGPDQLPRDQVDIGGQGPGEPKASPVRADVPAQAATKVAPSATASVAPTATMSVAPSATIRVAPSATARVAPSATASVAPSVEVRAGDHGEFERVVFEWPAAIDYDVVQRAEQVVVAFGRPGRIDFSQVKDRFGQRVLEASAEGGEVTERVALRVAPDAKIRSFSLEDDRIIVIDVFGGAASGVVSPALQTPLPRAERASQENDARAERSAIGSRVLLDEGRVRTPGAAAPSVALRVGDHGEFERVVFEWPAAIDYEVVHRAEQVIVAFSRPGRIDFSQVKDRFGQKVLEGRAEGGEVTERVALRVAPDARIRSFSLEDDRIVVIDVLAGAAPQSLAQPAPDPEASPIPELRRSLEQRDAVLEPRDALIENLLARVEQLERNQALSSGELDWVAAGTAGATHSGGHIPLPPTGAQAVAALEGRSGEAASEHSAAPADPARPEQRSTAASEGQDAGATNAATRPGEFDVVEEEIDRALERTLVQTGALLLPMGQAEVEPYFSYTRRETDAPALALVDGVPAGIEIEVARNEFVSGQTLRFGLPFDSQVEFDLPYQFVDQSTVTKIDFGERNGTNHSGHGTGDLSIGVAKTLVRENGGWWPDLIGRITWDTDTGETTSNDVALGGGFNELRGSLSAVKRQDPLAFIGGVSYETTFGKDDVQPGDALGFTIGTVLAASPGTSLRLALDQSFVQTSKIDGEGINGSDRVVGMATLGASVVLGRGILLDVAADIGLTDDAPEYAARASLPIRFNLPVY